MSADELREAAERLRSFEDGERSIYISLDVGLALAHWLELAAGAFDAVGFPAPEHEKAYPSVRIARLLNGLR